MSSKADAYYVTDPICSWCGGFSPVIESIRDEYRDRADFSIVVGGLRVGTKDTMTDSVRDTVVHHWKEVNKQTGQPFNFDFDVPEGFVYDTEPACRAVVTVRELDDTLVFDYLREVHCAFYLNNRNVVDTEILADIAVDAGIPRSDFLTRFEAADTRQKTLDDFAQALEWGIRGFPSVVLRERDRLRLLTVGYQGLESLRPLVDRWLETLEHTVDANESPTES